MIELEAFKPYRLEAILLNKRKGVGKYKIKQP